MSRCRTKTVGSHTAGVLRALRDLLQDATAGDPVTGMKWTHRSLRKLSKALRRVGLRASPKTVARLLKKWQYSLRTCRKQTPGVRHRDRDRQFRYLVRLRRLYVTRGWPVITVDTKKKEWIGNFKNPGRDWRRRPHRVLDHDFPSLSQGRAIPVGVYDVAHNRGFVVVGTTHETAALVGSAVRRWWRTEGQRRFPGAPRLLVQVDSGGANGYRQWNWKVELQNLADATGLIITVTHFPPGTSKWNPTDHRLFSVISANWAGVPLRSYETMLKHIRSSRTETGLRCRARLDCKNYPIHHKATREQIASVRIRRRSVFPQWNYTIYPHGRRIN